MPIEALEARLPAGARVVRAMPNTAAIALAAATAIAPGAHATPADIEVARALFEAVGRCVVLDESLLDAVTGLSGSGPAYVMLMIEALADGGVKVGLGRDTALLLAAQTVYGAAKLQLETGEHPGRLKDMVTSPGGTAIAGLHTLESGGLRRTLIDAVEAASAPLGGARRADGEEAGALEGAGSHRRSGPIETSDAYSRRAAIPCGGAQTHDLPSEPRPGHAPRQTAPCAQSRPRGRSTALPRGLVRRRLDARATAGRGPHAPLHGARCW